MSSEYSSARLRVISAEADPADPVSAEILGEVAEEAQLVARARTGDMGAWSRLYQGSFDGVYRYLGYLLGDADLTEDLTQETFVQALLGIRAFRGAASFTTWLHRIALNVVRQHWRRTRTRRRTKDRFARLVALDASPDEGLEATHLDRLRHEALYAVLDLVPAKLREAFVLRDLAGMSPAGAAEVLGISPGHVAVRAHRARARIRRELGRLGWVDERGPQ